MRIISMACVCVCGWVCVGVSLCPFVCVSVVIERVQLSSATNQAKQRQVASFHSTFSCSDFVFWKVFFECIFFFRCFKVVLSWSAAVFLPYIYIHSRTLFELPNCAPMMMMMTTAATIKQNFFDYFMHSGSCATSAFSLRQPQCNCGSAS